MQKAQIEDLFDRIRDEIRVLRGQNRFRGNEYYFLAQGLIRIPIENRKSEIQQGYFVIHAKKGEAELWAESVPEGEKLTLREYEMDLGKFVGEIVDRCRGEAYLHTNSSTADYRKEKEDREYGGD